MQTPNLWNVHNKMFSARRSGAVYYTVTDNLKRRWKTRKIGMLHFLLYVENFFVFFLGCLALILSHSSHGSFLVTDTTAQRPCSEGSSWGNIVFFFSDTSLGQKELGHTMVGVYEGVYVCVSVFYLCEKFVSFPDFIFCPQWSLFLFLLSCGRDYRNHFKARPCLLLLFFPPCFVGAFCIQHGRFWRWSALFLPPGPGGTLGGSVGNEASIICDLPHPLSPSVPTLRLSQAWRKLIVPPLCSTAHQTPACASPGSVTVRENLAQQSQRDVRFQVPFCPDAGPQWPGLKPTASWSAARARKGAEGRTRSWWLCVFPVIAMGIGKGDLINLPDELCITSASGPPSLKALLFELLESHHLTPPCVESCCPTSIREAFGTWSLGSPNRVPPASWQNYWNMCKLFKNTCACVPSLFLSLCLSFTHTHIELEEFINNKPKIYDVRGNSAVFCSLGQKNLNTEVAIILLAVF